VLGSGRGQAPGRLRIGRRERLAGAGHPRQRQPAPADARVAAL